MRNREESKSSARIGIMRTLSTFGVLSLSVLCSCESKGPVFDGELALEGYSHREVDGHEKVELKWSASRKPSADYWVFVHAMDGSGSDPSFQLDHPLKNGGKETSRWDAGDSVKDIFPVTPRGNRPAGTYMLRIGLYVPSPTRILQLTQVGNIFQQPADEWRRQAIVITDVDCK